MKLAELPVEHHFLGSLSRILVLSKVARRLHAEGFDLYDRALQEFIITQADKIEWPNSSLTIDWDYAKANAQAVIYFGVRRRFKPAQESDWWMAI